MKKCCFSWAPAVHDWMGLMSMVLFIIIDTMKKWCEEGSIELTLTCVYMVGPPGSGKTCTQCLLLNEPPPKHA